MVSAIEMSHLNGARGSFYVLRPKNTIEFLTQSAEKWVCMGERAVPCGAILFLRLQKGPRRSDFSGALFATTAVPEKLSKKDL